MIELNPIDGSENCIEIHEPAIMGGLLVIPCLISLRNTGTSLLKINEVTVKAESGKRIEVLRHCGFQLMPLSAGWLNLHLMNPMAEPPSGSFKITIVDSNGHMFSAGTLHLEMERHVTGDAAASKAMH